MTAHYGLLVSILVSASVPAQPRLDEYGDPLPARALARLGSTRPQHVWTIKAVAFSPDGKSLASCDERTVRVWDIATGKQLQLHRDEHLDGLAVLAFSPDGKWLAAGGRRWATIFDVSARTLERKLDHGKAPVRHLSFTSDGRALLTADNLTPRQWETASGKLIRAFPSLLGFENGVAALMVLPTCNRLLVFESHNAATWWDLDTGEQSRRLALERGGSSRAALSPDGKWLIRSLGYGKPLGCIDLATGKLARTFSPGDFRIAPSFSADGAHVIGFEEKNLCFWRISDGAKVVELERHHDFTGQIAVAPDGKSFAYAIGCRVLVLDSATGKLRQTIGTDTDRIKNVSFLPDGKTAVVLTARNRQLWDLPTSKVREARVPLFSYEHVQDQFLVSTKKENILLWDLARGEKIQTLATGGDPRTPMCFSPDQALFAASIYLPTPEGKPSRRAVRVWEVRTGKLMRTFDVSTMGMEALAFTPDGQSLAMTLKRDATVDLVFWSLNTGDSHSRRLHGLRAAPEIVFSPDGRLLAVSSRYVDCLDVYLGIFVYEVATGRQLWTVRAGDQSPYVTFRDHLQFSRDGQSLMAVQGDHVQIWHAASGKPRARLSGHEILVTSLALSPDGRTLLTGGLDTTVVCWDVADLLRPALTPQSLTQKELRTCWLALGDQNPAVAYRAMHDLGAAPTQSIAWLREHLRAVPPPDEATINKHVAALGDASYDAREQAVAALEGYGAIVAPTLQKKMREPLALETRRRLESLCAKLSQFPVGADDLRGIRGVAVLERLEVPASRQLLEKLSAGAPDARLTREAESALRRLPARASRESPGASR